MSDEILDRLTNFLWDKFETSNRTIKDDYRYLNIEDVNSDIDISNIKIWNFDELVQPVYDYDVNNIENWIQKWYKNCYNLSDYMLSYRQFLDGIIAATPQHGGSINTETLLIKEELDKIIRTGFLTEDSQPSIMLETYIQKPYLQISSNLNNIYLLLEHIYLYYPSISVVTLQPIDDQESFITKQQYPNLTLFSVFLATNDSFYYFNNDFFIDIATACNTLFALNYIKL